MHNLAEKTKISQLKVYNTFVCGILYSVYDGYEAMAYNMPLEECYKIITNGRGEDFDPEVVDAFLTDKSKVEEIYHNY